MKTDTSRICHRPTPAFVKAADRLRNGERMKIVLPSIDWTIDLCIYLELMTVHLTHSSRRLRVKIEVRASILGAPKIVVLGSRFAERRLAEVVRRINPERKLDLNAKVF